MAKTSWDNFKAITDNVQEEFFNIYCREHVSESRKAEGSHLVKKLLHVSEINRVTFKKLGKNEIEFVWVRCEKCNEIRHKYVMAWNSEENVGYQKVLRKPVKNSKSEF